MDKNNKATLVDFLFPQSTNRHNKKLIISDQSSHLNQQQKNVSSTAKQGNRGRCLRVNEMNSSVVIWDEKRFQKDIFMYQSLPPQKNFNIKRMKDVKKLGISIQNIVKLQLKKRQTIFNFDCHRSFSIQNSRPLEKMVVKAQSKRQIQMDQNNIPHLHQQHNPMVTEYLKNQKKELIGSKCILSETQISTKQYFHHDTQEKLFEHSQFTAKIDQLHRTQKKCVTSPRKSYSRRLQESKKYQEMVEQQRKDILQLKKELNKNYAKPFSPPENITAYSYILYEANAKRSKFLHKFNIKQDEKPQTRKTLLNSYKVLASLNSRSPVEIASLTKIMTCILALDLSARFKAKISQQLVLIGSFEQNIGGTSANIRKGQIYSVQQLLYGLMLPSGNDASLAVAVWGGKMLIKSEGHKGYPLNKKDCYERFIVQMNRQAQKLNMEKTKYANSHGLSNSQNKSCPYDLALLCEYSMNNPTFRQIVACRTYETTITMEKEQQAGSLPQQINIAVNLSMRSVEKTLQLQQMKDFWQTNEVFNEQETVIQKYKMGVGCKDIKWQSPHQLLQTMPELYIGIKTGITDSAGPCLSSCFQFKGRRFIVIVLNCKSMKFRFKDTENLRRWFLKKEQVDDKNTKQ